MARRSLVIASVMILSAVAMAGCSPSAQDKAKQESQDAAAKLKAVAGDAATEAKTAASQAKDAVETAASNHGIGVKETPDFVKTAALSDMFEIKSSQLALKVSKDPAVKAFARQMIADHTKMSRGMKAAVAKAGVVVDVPTDLDSGLQSKLDDLKSAAPGDFDKKYLDDQRGGHEAAVGMFKAYADNGADPTIKAVAAGALPMIQSHLDAVKALQKAQDDAKSHAK